MLRPCLLQRVSEYLLIFEETDTPNGITEDPVLRSCLLSPGCSIWFDGVSVRLRKLGTVPQGMSNMASTLRAISVRCSTGYDATYSFFLGPTMIADLLFVVFCFSFVVHTRKNEHVRVYDKKKKKGHTKTCGACTPVSSMSVTSWRAGEDADVRGGD